MSGALISVCIVARKLGQRGWPSTLNSVEMALAACLAAVQLLFPRRPDVFTPDDHIVDLEGSASALARYTMRWSSLPLALASMPGAESLKGFPVHNYASRSRNQPLIARTSAKDTVWSRLLAERWPGLAKQWAFMFARSIATFGSPYCVMRLLKALEAGGDVGSEARKEAWLWLVALGATSICHSIIDYQLIWIQWSEMGLPVRAQLIMALFGKLLRRKDAHDAKTKGGRPDAINLITADTHSLSQFTAVNYLIPSAFSKFGLAVCFLYNILGWQPTLAGVVVTLFCVYGHTFTIRRQHDVRKQLTASRDKKTRVVTEALHALRQIKFSALEGQWEAHIGEFRRDELDLVHRSYVAKNMRAIWDIAAPYTVATACVYTYVHIHGSISSSIVFPMMAVLPQLEETVGFVPFVLLHYFGARTNARRMDDYLASGDQEPILTPTSGDVTLDGVSVAWQSDNGEKAPSSFALEGLNLAFPAGELSVISGATGSGKSLLLSAIIGEAELRNGTVHAPAAAQGRPVAYVSQTPWLQNASVKENILFGSPLRQDRYDKVVEACALQHDLAALPNGDDTLVGFGGVKLSGGQRARLAFARALYADTPLMVLDDIFSALDSHVAKEIFAALTGPLGQGRTRILATHHVSLCLSRAKYLVQLSDGTSKYAGVPDSTHAEPEKAHEQKSQAPDEIKPETKSSKAKSKATKPKQKKDANADIKLYKAYFAAAGGLRFAAVYAFGLVFKQIFNAVTQWLLGRVKSSSDGATNYLSVYMWTSAAGIALQCLFNMHAHAGSQRASTTLFRKQTARVLRMPIVWLDATPVGEMLKAFTVDTRLVDDAVLGTLSESADSAVKTLVVLGVGLSTSKYSIVMAAVLLVLCFRAGRTYLRARSPMKRADAAPTADMLEHFTSCAAGISTIRAFGASERAMDVMHGHVDRFTLARRYFWIFNRWIGLEISFIGIAFTLGTGVFLLLRNMDTGTAGFALTFSTSLYRALFLMINKYGILETDMSAVGRVVRYTELETEDQGGTDAPKDWPSHGGVEIHKLQVGYAADLPPVLKNITLYARPGQRIGVVGRTGAGKSSLTLSLLRLLEPRSGVIRIDDVDISTLKLTQLRSKIAFIPQDPVLFSGTIRSNLDYFQRVPEAKLHDALQSTGLLADSRLTLDSPVSTGGTNLSQGQRQLLCLARILVTEAKIVVLDEATSAIDDETDTFIQGFLRTRYTGTLLVVAHRLATIASFDAVMVMRDGEIAEFGCPNELLAAKGGFYDLVHASADSESLVKIIM